MTLAAAPAPAPQVAYITFSTDVNPATTQNLLNIMGNCVNQRITEVHLLISTGGGSIMHGVNAYNVLRGMPFKLVTHNVANVDSIGSALFLAGDERYACPSATFMFHGVAYTAPNVAFDIRLAKARLAGLQADETRLVNVVEAHTNMTVQQVRRLYQGWRTMDAAEAVKVGLAHDIRDVVIPNTAQVATVTG